MKKKLKKKKIKMSSKQQKKEFNSSSGLKMTTGGVSNQITEFMKSEPNKDYKVIIGTDSQALEGREADFVTAIVVHRQGHGGRYFWRRIKNEVFHTMRDRIINEVMTSLDTAKEILKKLKQDLDDTDWDFEIHVDVGSNGPSRKLIQEVVGMVRANNFEARTKPQAYAASSVADKHV